MNSNNLLDFLRGTVFFVLNIVLSVVILGLTVYFIVFYTGKAYDYGQKLALEMYEEKPDESVEVTIPEDATIDEVASLLEKEGIIANALLYRVENMLKGSAGNYTGGTFTLNMNMDASEINSALRQTDTVQQSDIKITIREGFSVRNIADYLESNEIVSAEEFIKACNENDFDFDFLRDIPDRENRLEGYLFPDTYFLPANPTPNIIINKMLARFEQIYVDKYGDKAKELGLTMDEVVTIASIIEKEIRVPEERPLCAEVIYNRLDTGMNLQMCSTVLYVLGIRKDRLTDADLATPSPYNTYLNNGLPIGPIANPGEACIRAALEPGTGDLLYFVVKDEETGEHVFTDKYEEFEAAKIQYKQKY